MEGIIPAVCAAVLVVGMVAVVGYCMKAIEDDGRRGESR